MRRQGGAISKAFVRNVRFVFVVFGSDRRTQQLKRCHIVPDPRPHRSTLKGVSASMDRFGPYDNYRKKVCVEGDLS